ncbi:MAG: Abi family protein [Verrucomicrobia bacterium]|nr:Abi family protein [Verrucomicrobiota bacterium]
MKYTKPALTFPDQADLLLKRGLVAPSRQAIIEKLQAVSYYRLSAYWFPFRQPDDTLKPGTTLEMVWRRYTFDRQLRCLVLDAIERVEISVRTQLVCQHSLKHGPFGYLDRAKLPGLNVTDHRDLLNRIHDEAGRSREDFVRHFFSKYTSETDLPLWMACELMTFGAMFTLFRGVETSAKQTIAAEYGVADRVLESWLATFNQVRNLCAHHARLWNRAFGVRPQIPRPNKHPDWHHPVAITNDRLFGVMTVLHYLLLRVAPQSQWRQRWENLLARYADIPIAAMGFPANWKDSPLWQTTALPPALPTTPSASPASGGTP